MSRCLLQGLYQAALALINLAGLDSVAEKIGHVDAEEIIKKKKQKDM